MLRFGWPSVLAAGAAGAYATKEVQQSSSWPILRGLLPSLDSNPSTSGRGSGGTGNGEIQALQGELDRMHRLLTDVMRNGGRQNGALVIHTGPGGRSWLWWPAAGVLLCVGYCKLRGWSVLDFLYVSRGSLSSFRDYVSEGFGKMWDELRRQKDQMLERLQGVDAKQQQLMHNQEAMDQRLRQVGNSVDDIKDSTNKINSHMRVLDDRMTQMHDMVGQSQTGIMLLCHVLSDIVPKQNSRAVQLLKNFINGAGSMLGTGAAGGAAPPLASASSAALLPPWEGSQSSIGGAAASSASALGSAGSTPAMGLAGLAADTGARVAPAPTIIAHDDRGAAIYKGGGAPATADGAGTSGAAAGLYGSVSESSLGGLYGVSRLVGRT